jgi:N-acetylglucosamine kinase-like BadF-type ATPase
MKKQNFVIGVDGGGTKTVLALANLEGKILKIRESLPSSPRNFGIKKAVFNLVLGLKKILPKKGKISATFIGLPAVTEEYKSKIKKIKGELKKYKEISKIFKGKVKIGSDQEVAFRAGAKGDGIILIAGTGCVAHGWKGEEELKVSGWGYLGDEGSSFFVGQKSFQAILKSIDGRGEKTILKDSAFKKLKLKNEIDFVDFIYKNPVQNVPLISVFCDLAAKKGDKIAKKIILEAAKEAALNVKPIVKKLNFRNKKFPLVLTGGLFHSKIFLREVKKIIKEFARKADFILLKEKPVRGAINLALEMIRKT